MCLQAGTEMFMAPEVAAGEAYSAQPDTYGTVCFLLQIR